MKIIRNLTIILLCMFCVFCSGNKTKQEYLIFKSYEQDINYMISESTSFRTKIDTLYISIKNNKTTYIYYKNKEKIKIKEKFIFNKKECLHIRFHDGNIDTLRLTIVKNKIIEKNINNSDKIYREYRKKNYNEWEILKLTTKHTSSDICYTYFFNMNVGLIMKKAVYQDYVYELKHMPNIEEIDDLISLISNDKFFYRGCD
ncbi:MAG: hypothetical protein EAZ06_10750 [Cytophagales bacterium]|nr:MAG: hypothetical protein EAZ06_10750 [Cytophagales bacterium]